MRDRFHLQILGNELGPKLVFLHGLMGSGANWRKITPYFENAYHILLIDQRGHGRSFQPESGYSPEDYAQDLYEILEHLQWKQVMLVGHSMGGRNALCFASQWPDRVKKLVIEDIGPELQDAGARRIEELLDQVHTPYVSRAEARRDLLEEFPLRISSSQAHTLAQFFYSNLEEKKNGQVDWRFSLSGIRESLRAGRVRDRWQEWEMLKVPTLVIRGQHSQDLPLEIFSRMRKRENVIGVEIPNAGHWVHFDQPQRFTEVLLQFLK